jgi:hypothetical protein
VRTRTAGRERFGGAALARREGPVDVATGEGEGLTGEALRAVDEGALTTGFPSARAIASEGFAIESHAMAHATPSTPVKMSFQSAPL